MKKQSKLLWQYREFGTLAWNSTNPKNSGCTSYEEFEKRIRFLGYDEVRQVAINHAPPKLQVFNWDVHFSEV